MASSWPRYISTSLSLSSRCASCATRSTSSRVIFIFFGSCEQAGYSATGAFRFGWSAAACRELVAANYLALALAADERRVFVVVFVPHAARSGLGGHKAHLANQTPAPALVNFLAEGILHLLELATPIFSGGGDFKNSVGATHRFGLRGHFGAHDAGPRRFEPRQSRAGA